MSLPDTVDTVDTVETDRLILRAQEVGDAAILRQLWSERDVRVPVHRQIDSEGRPSVDDIVAGIGRDHHRSGLRLLTVQLKDTADVIGYCGLIAHGNGSSGEPEIAFELLRTAHGRGYATEAARAVVGWADGEGYRRLWAGVWSWNVASRRVLAKLGFRELGRMPPASKHGHTLLTVREAYRGRSAA